MHSVKVPRTGISPSQLADLFNADPASFLGSLAGSGLVGVTLVITAREGAGSVTLSVPVRGAGRPVSSP
jgi:hypothetical protein